MKKQIKSYILVMLRYTKVLDRVPLGLRMVNLIFQRVLRINSRLKIPIHFTSNISTADRLHYHADESTLISFAYSGNCYIQTYNHIYLGKNILFSKGLNLISANHSDNNMLVWNNAEAIRIGDNVWIGANVTILPAVIIGNNCIVGAGSVVTKSFNEDNLVIAGNPAHVIRTNKTKKV